MYTYGNKIVISSATSVLKSSTLMPSGQTTVYRTGDDADTSSEGRATDFFTLNTAPVHADGSATANTTTNRFTDELGGQTYTNDIVIDWSTYDNVAETVLGYRRTLSGSTLLWNDAIDGALTVSIGSFSTGWRLPNFMELNNICCFENNGRFNYAPFNLTVSEIWSSTTNPGSSSQAYAFQSLNTILRGKTSSLPDYLPVRTFTVSGTSLT